MLKHGQRAAKGQENGTDQSCAGRCKHPKIAGFSGHAWVAGDHPKASKAAVEFERKSAFAFSANDGF